MQRAGLRNEAAFRACLAQSEHQVDVLPVREQRLVEPADFEKRFAEERGRRAGGTEGWGRAGRRT